MHYLLLLLPPDGECGGHRLMLRLVHLLSKKDVRDHLLWLMTEVSLLMFFQLVGRKFLITSIQSITIDTYPCLFGKIFPS